MEINARNAQLELEDRSLAVGAAAGGHAIESPIAILHQRPDGECPTQLTLIESVPGRKHAIRSEAKEGAIAYSATDWIIILRVLNIIVAPVLRGPVEIPVTALHQGVRVCFRSARWRNHPAQGPKRIQGVSAAPQWKL